MSHDKRLDEVGPNGVPVRFDGNREAARAEYERIDGLSFADLVNEARKKAGLPPLEKKPDA